MRFTEESWEKVVGNFFFKSFEEIVNSRNNPLGEGPFILQTLGDSSVCNVRIFQKSYFC
jgi:hypothetical protein